MESEIRSLQMERSDMARRIDLLQKVTTVPWVCTRFGSDISCTDGIDLALLIALMPILVKRPKSGQPP